MKITKYQQMLQFIELFSEHMSLTYMPPKTLLSSLNANGKYFIRFNRLMLNPVFKL